MEDGIWAIGDGILAKMIFAVIGALSGIFGGWWMSRASIMTAVDQRVNSQMNRFEKEIERLTKRCEAAETSCDEARESHRACEGRLDALEHDKAELARKLDALMSGPVAKPGDKAPS